MYKLVHLLNTKTGRKITNIKQIKQILTKVISDENLLVYRFTCFPTQEPDTSHMTDHMGDVIQLPNGEHFCIMLRHHIFCKNKKSKNTIRLQRYDEFWREVFGLEVGMDLLGWCRKTKIFKLGNTVQAHPYIGNTDQVDESKVEYFGYNYFVYQQVVKFNSKKHWWKGN